MQTGYDAGAIGPEVRTTILIEAAGGTVGVPEGGCLRDAVFSREGAELVLTGLDGAVVIEGYFAAQQQPLITAPDGTALTPSLVQSFLDGGTAYAHLATSNDVSPVGSVAEVVGQVMVTRLDGSTEQAALGTPIYEGDIVETGIDGAINIVFVDETSFAVAEDARLAIDEYVFDPQTQVGVTEFSILKGIFVFTSGLIGREDPDDVTIDTPMGSIGIRGTIIAGNVSTGEITVIEGAIVLRSLFGDEVTLANQFDTARFNPEASTVDMLGTLSAEAISASFASLSAVAGNLFSSVNELRPDHASESLGTPQEEERGEVVRPEAESDEPAQESPTDQETRLLDQQPAIPSAEVKPAPLINPANAAQHHGDMLHAQLTTAMGVDLAREEQPLSETHHSPQQRSQPAAGLPRLDDLDNVYVTQPPQTVNRPPMHERDMPSEYFALLKEPGRSFAYNFSPEFHDPEGMPLSYSMSGSQNIDGVDVQFNSATGLLTLTLGADLITLPTEMAIQIIASDGVNQAVATPVTLRFLDHDGVLQDGPPFGNGNSSDDVAQVLQEDGHNRIGSDGANKTVFLDGVQPNDFKVLGDNNVIYVGENAHDRTVLLDEVATGNTVFGGAHNETFEIKNANNTVYGLAGDDKAVLHLDEIDSAGLDNLHIDLGDESDHLIAWGKAFATGALEYLNQLAQEGAGTFGDTLKLSGTGSFDFSQVRTLKGIDTLDLTDSDAQLVTLRPDDILSDAGSHHSAMVIRGDANDTVDLINYEASGEQIALEDDTYDVYSGYSGDSSITLLIDSGINVI